MPSRFFLVATATVMLAVSGCGPSIRVVVSVAPSANFSGYRRFQVVMPRGQMDGRRAADDPMLVNPITSRALEANVSDAFIRRGYALDSAAPDFKVAYYVSERDRIDAIPWNYGNAPWFDGRPQSPAALNAAPYAEGTVIIDVVDSKTNELVWRGRGQAKSSTDPEEFQKDLRDAVSSIVREFPAASVRVALAR